MDGQHRFLSERPDFMSKAISFQQSPRRVASTLPLRVPAYVTLVASDLPQQLAA